MIVPGRRMALAIALRPEDFRRGADVAWVLGSKPQARAVIQPEPSLLWLLSRRLEPLQTPDAFNPLDVHGPALRPQHRRDPAVAITARTGWRARRSRR